MSFLANGFMAIEYAEDPVLLPLEVNFASLAPGTWKKMTTC